MMYSKDQANTDESLIYYGAAVVETEGRAVMALKDRIGADFARACRLLLDCRGRIVVTGMGKSGHIGRKIAASLASTGTPAFFLHPAEANHGDLGMITRQDVVVALSYSGHTEEVMTLLPVLKRLEVPIISMTGNPQSVLAQRSTLHLDISVAEEACPFGLAPTASTTATLVMGDALMIALLQARGFTEEEFALSHPGGALGRRLLLQISDVMRTGVAVPIISEKAVLSEALVEMTKKSLGMTAVVDEQGKLVGLFTDGDLRRVLDKGLDVHHTFITEVMTRRCKTVVPTMLAAEALSLMEKHRINGFIVVDEEQRPIGAFNLHELLQAGVM